MTTLIAITGLGVFCLLLEIFNLRKGIIPFAVVALLGILGLTISEYGTSASFYNNMIVVNKFSVAFSSLFIVLATFLVAMSAKFYEHHQTKISDYVAIKIFLLAGAVAMVSFGNLAMYFLGIEILSIALYILCASDRTNLKSNESGMKYFLMGAFASGFILFGICLVYGAMGSFDMDEIASLSLSAELPAWFFIGVMMITIGMLFKIAIVPFHFWAPDVYEGAPALTTALMSTLTKVVAIATLYKLLVGFNAELNESFATLIVILSIASMTVGNIMALRQTNVKRMLAFSGISHAGFMIMTLLVLQSSQTVLFYYAAAYALAGIAAFAVIIYVCKDHENEDITNFHGLAKTNPILAVVLTGAMLSMGGIPVFSGFFAKLFLFDTMLQEGYIVLVIVAVINSIISIGYYFKLILAMYGKEPNESRGGISIIYHSIAIIAILMNIVIGLFPSLILNLF